MPINRVGEIIDVIEGVETKMSDFISGPTPSNPILQSVQSSYRKSCNRYSAAPGFLQNLGPSAQSIGRICKAYLDDNAYSLPQPQSPGVGACPLGYEELTLNYDSFGNNLDLVLTLDPPLPGPWRIELQGNAYNAVNSNGDIAGGVSSSAENVVISGGVLEGGVPDDGSCVAPDDPLVPGPNPAPNPGPEFEPTAPTSPGNPWIPVFPIPDTYDDPVYGPSPIPPVSDPTPYPPIPDPDGPIVDVGDETDDNPPDDTDEETQESIIGVVVSVTQLSEGLTVVDQGDAPTLYIPRLGAIYFSMTTDDGPVWSGPFQVNNRRVVIFTPDLQAAEAVVFAPYRGAIAELTVLRRPAFEAAE